MVSLKQWHNFGLNMADCKHVFFSASFPNTKKIIIISIKWHKSTQPNRIVRQQKMSLSADEWINKMGHIHSIEYYSAIKINEMLTHATKWVTLEKLTLSERRQSQKPYII